jgi:heterodisulfide reductase subunit D
MDAPLEQALERRLGAMFERCTACGACVTACPMPGPAGIDATDAPALAAGVLALLRGAAHPAASARWAEVCSGSGHCIAACPEGVNPRFLLAMGRLATQAGTDDIARRKLGFERFAAMTAGVRVLSRLQLSPELLARFRGEDEAAAAPDIVFYTGCNILKTPHIALLCLDILDALGLRYRVVGGPAQCCGTLQFGAGDVTTAGRIAYRTLDRLAAAGGRVLTWCPTCQVQLGEIVAPSRGEASPALTPFVLFLAERLDQLRPLLRRPVRKRVALHEHPGIAGVTAAATAILRAIPGIDFVDLAQPQVGYMCNKLNALPAFKRSVHEGLLAAADALGVETLAGVYHVCHRELCCHERNWPFDVVNFLELVGESMGLARPDLFKRLKLLQDADAILAEAAPLIAANGLDRDEARRIVLTDMLGEQPLPLRQS